VDKSFLEILLQRLGKRLFRAVKKLSLVVKEQIMVWKK
jgi:hypothetical protein